MLDLHQVAHFFLLRRFTPLCSLKIAVRAKGGNKMRTRAGGTVIYSDEFAVDGWVHVLIRKANADS